MLCSCLEGCIPPFTGFKINILPFGLLQLARTHKDIRGNFQGAGYHKAARIGVNAAQQTANFLWVDNCRMMSGFVRSQNSLTEGSGSYSTRPVATA